MLSSTSVVMVVSFYLSHYKNKDMLPTWRSIFKRVHYPHVDKSSNGTMSMGTDIFPMPYLLIAMFDLAKDETSHKLAAKFAEAGKVVA